MKFIVYRAIFENGKSYVGVTTKGLTERTRKHVNCARNGSTFKFHKALRKYNYRVEWEILEECDNEDQMLYFEEYYIEMLNSYENGYNSTLGGDLNLGRVVEDKTREMLSRINRGRNNPNYGKTRTLESKIKCALSNGASPFEVFMGEKKVGEWIGKKTCAKDLGIDNTRISACLNRPNKHKTHKGYTFKYITPAEET